MLGLSPSLFYSIIWGLVLLIALIAEASTMALVAVWFMPGAFLALLLAALGVPVGWQVAVFTVISIIALLLTRPICKRMKTKAVQTNIDAVIGKDVYITEDIDNLCGKGTAKLAGQIWTARTEDDACHLMAGDVATVVAVSGVKLILAPKK